MRIVQIPRVVTYRWACLCVLKRQYMFAAFRAGLYGGEVGAVGYRSALDRLKMYLADSIAGHQDGECRWVEEKVLEGEFSSIWSHDYSYQDQESAGQDRADTGSGTTRSPTEPAER